MKSAENRGLQLNSKLSYLVIVLLHFFFNFFELLMMGCCRNHIKSYVKVL